MRRLALLMLAAMMVVVVGCSSKKATPSPAPTPTPTPTASPTPVITPSPTAAALDGDWIVFAPADQNFTAKFPGTPTLTTQTQQTAVGPAPMSTWTYTQGATMVYAVTVANYPKGSMKGVTGTSVYAGFLSGIAGATGTIEQEPSTLNGHSGVAFAIDKGTATLAGVVYLVGDDLYVAYVAYASATAPDELDVFVADFGLKV